MLCPICKGDQENKEQIKQIIKEQKIPFSCPECGMIKLPVKATLDRVLVWADPVEDKIGKLGLIHLPEIVKDNYKTVFGTVVSVGPGYYDAKRNNRFVDTKVKVGDRIAYDKDVLYKLSLRDSVGKKYYVALMGHEDIHGCVE